MKKINFIVSFIILAFMPKTFAQDLCLQYFSQPTKVERMAQGERVYKQEGDFYSLDSNSRHDLKVVERLLPQLNHTRSVFGADRLVRLLENPYLSEQEIIARQNAVKELVANQGLREQVQQSLDSLRLISTSYLKEHLKKSKSPASYRSNAVIMGLLFSASVGGAIVLGNPGLAMVGMYMNLMMGGPVISDANRNRYTASSYKELFRVSEKLSLQLQDAQSPNLQEIAASLSAVYKTDHPLSLSTLRQPLKRLHRAGWATQILDITYGHGAWSLLKLERALVKEKEKIATLVTALAELDVFLSLAEHALEHPQKLTFPTILEQETPFLEIADGHNPYLFAHGERSVPNSFMASGNPQLPNFTILTGANAGGKSTFLTMIGMMSVQAQIGAAVPARALVLTPVELMTNIDLSDSLETGKSFFRMEAQRLAQILKRTREQPKLLIIMDEILLGTNPQDRHAIEQEVIRELTATGRLALLATHDIQVTKLANEVQGIQNIQVEEVRGADGKFEFTFKIVPGVSTTSTAYEVMRAEGVPTDLVERALQNRSTQKAAD